MTTTHLRRPENVAGDLFVDSSCIDCDTCRWMAPASFDRAGEQSRVHTQPAGDAERLAALQALVSCPTASIRSESRADLAAAIASLPAPVDGPVLHCGWHAESSFGAASWLVRREAGNLLVDSPRFVRPLVERIEALGGIHTVVLTHKDDVADSARYAEHFGARCVMHAADAAGIAPPPEVLIEGDAEVALDDDLLLIPTPGHTEGSVCLLVANRYLFTGDHLAWSARRDRVIAFASACWFDWTVQRRSVERLLQHRFEWILPGHGERVRLPPDEMARQVRACAEWMATVRAG